MLYILIVEGNKNIKIISEEKMPLNDLLQGNEIFLVNVKKFKFKNQ